MSAWVRPIHHRRHRGDEHRARRQPVEAVDQVDRVDHDQHPADRERHVEGPGRQPSAKRQGDDGDAEAEEGEDHGRGGLEDQLHGRRGTLEVVERAQDQDRHARQRESQQRPRVDTALAHRSGDPEGQPARREHRERHLEERPRGAHARRARNRRCEVGRDSRSQARREHRERHRNPTEGRHRRLVDAPRPGMVQGTPAPRRGDHERRERQCRDQRNHEQDQRERYPDRSAEQGDDHFSGAAGRWRSSSRRPEAG
jgi:hypothetical protein